MADHPLLHAGAGRFWRPRDRTTSSGNIPPSARYHQLDGGRQCALRDDSASETFDPLLPPPRDSLSSRHSFSHSPLGDVSSERLGRSPSIASGSSSASGDSRFHGYSISALSLPNASSLSVQSQPQSQRLDRVASQANRIRNEERKNKLISHIQQLEKLEELRVSGTRRGSESSDPNTLQPSASYSNIRASAKSDDDSGSLASTDTHRPSVSDVASINHQTNKPASVGSGGTRPSSGAQESVRSSDSLPAALKLSETAAQPRYKQRQNSGPALHLDNSPIELDPSHKKSTHQESRTPKLEIPLVVELNSVRSPTELLAVDAPWSQEPRQFELPTTRPTMKRKPYPEPSLDHTERPRTSSDVSELPWQTPKSPTLSTSPAQARLDTGSSQATKSLLQARPRPTRPVSANPDPDAFRPSISSQLLGLIPPQMPKRAAPPPLPTPNTFELSTSASVAYRPRANSADPRTRRRVSPAKLDQYNTVLHAPFPLLPKDEEQAKQEAEDEKAQADKAGDAHEAGSSDEQHKRLTMEEYLDGGSSPPISIEPDIDPRTGKRWIGSLS